MPRIIQDEEIKTLLAEPKPIPSFWRSRLELKRKANEAHAESAFVFEVESGHVFSIRIRAARDNARDFSVILSLLEGGAEYVLIRHNGRHKSAHTNLIEYAAGIPHSRFSNVCHIHQATERYQRHGKIHGFAEPTTLYSDRWEAEEEMVKRYGMYVVVNPSMGPLFESTSQDEK